MGIKVIERKYKNQFYSDSQSTDWLLGNVGDWQRLELTFEASIDFKATNSETVTIDSNENTISLNNGKSWQDYGFDLGDEVIFQWTLLQDTNNDGVWSEAQNAITFTIINIYGDTIETDADFDFQQFNIFPTDRGNVKIIDVKFQTVKEPEGLKFQYSHISNENYQTSNLTSFIDGTTTEFSFAGLQNLVAGADVPMNTDGFQSGMAIENCYIQKISENAGNEAVFNFPLLSNQLVRNGNINPGSNTNIPYGSRSLQMTLTNAGGYLKSSYTNEIPVSNNGQYLSLSNSNSVFINNSTENVVRYFNINLSFVLTEAVDSSNQDLVRFVLHKYTGGTNYNYSQTIVLKTWVNANELVGNTLNHNGVVGINIQENESYVLALEYYHPQVSGRVRSFKYSILNGTMKEVGGNTTNKYKITCDFMLASIFEEVSNLENMEMPSILFDAGSLTDNFNIILYPEWNNPNTVIKNDLKHTERLGNTGWFNENVNGLDNNFNVESLRYYDLDGNLIDQLDYTNTVILEAEISGLNNLTTDTEVGFGFAWIPQDEESYKHKNTPYHKNLLINTGRKYEGGSFNVLENTGSTSFEGSSFNNAKMNVSANNGTLFTIAGTDKVKLSAKFEPNADFVNFFNEREETDRKYILWMSVADPNLQINFSDRVSMLLDYKDMVKVIPPAGPLDGMTNKFIEHPQADDVAGVDKYKGHIEDDILSRVFFNIDKTKKFIRNIIFGYEIENIDTGSTYRLEEFPNNVAIFPPDANGEQNIDIDTTRGFKTVIGNNKNVVKISKVGLVNSTGNLVTYKGMFATKIRWEDWLERSQVPNEFYNGALPLNGFHNNWLDYLRNTGNYRFNFFVETIVEEAGDVKAHKNTFELEFNGYDENLNIKTEHNYYRHSDNTLLNVGLDAETNKPLGVILSNEPTRVEIIYTNLAGDFDFQKLYCVTSLEVDKGAGEMEYRQLSSVWISEGDNPLKPLDGEDKLKIELLAPNVVKATCLIDPNLLEQVSRYKITGRIGCFAEGNNIPTDDKERIYEQAYEQAYE